MKGSFILLAVFLMVDGIALAREADAPKGPSARFKITTRKQDDCVAVRVERDKTLFIVKSPSGIGQAVIERVEKRWPKEVLLRLHLNGLESFRASNGKVTLHASASVHNGKHKVRLWQDGKEDAPLNEKSPLWTGIRIQGGDGKPAQVLPLKSGYFEMSLPKAFFDGNPRSITVNWIDFYR